MEFKTIDDLKTAGFEGFVPVEELRGTLGKAVPSSPGIYMAVRTSQDAPRFLEVGTGGYFKRKNPNVPMDELEKNWVAGTCVVYIGKATSLRNRIGQYLKFGLGQPAAHYGGRYVWQLSDADALLFCWKSLTSGEEPEIVETELISDFKRQHDGRRPFANLVK